MSKQASPTLIGGFVVGAIVLIVSGLLIFGGGAFFADRETYVAYFTGSVQGLRIGAPVDFRGVSLGQVKDITVLYDERDLSMSIRVLIEINHDRLTIVGGDAPIDQEDNLDQLISQGLRAQLQVTSMVTGLLSVELDFHPDAPLDLVGTDTRYAEMPTIPSRMEEIERSLGAVAVEIPGMIKNMNGLLTELSTGLGPARANFQKIVTNLAAFTDRLDKVGPMLESMADEAEQSVGAMRRVADTADRILTDNEEAIDATITELQSTAVAVKQMADQVNNLVAENRQGLRDFTETGLYEFTGLAQDAQRMVNQITRVTEQLERDPGRFLFGDRGQGVTAE